MGKHEQANRLAGDTPHRGNDLLAVAERNAAVDNDHTARADHERRVGISPQVLGRSSPGCPIKAKTPGATTAIGAGGAANANPMAHSAALKM